MLGGHQGDVLLVSEIDGLPGRVFSADEDDGFDISDQGGADNLGVAQAGEQHRFRFNGGKNIAHQICTHCTGDIPVISVCFGQDFSFYQFD